MLNYSLISWHQKSIYYIRDYQVIEINNELYANVQRCNGTYILSWYGTYPIKMLAY